MRRLPGMGLFLPGRAMDAWQEGSRGHHPGRSHTGLASPIEAGQAPATGHLAGVRHRSLVVGQGLDSRKNTLPCGGVMVTLFVPLAVVTVYPLAAQLAAAARLLFCCKV